MAKKGWKLTGIVELIINGNNLLPGLSWKFVKQQNCAAEVIRILIEKSSNASRAAYAEERK